eukprot:scaffold545548_cov55-Prasinocladus_malaysianus.AAC.1
MQPNGQAESKLASWHLMMKQRGGSKYLGPLDTDRTESSSRSKSDTLAVQISADDPNPPIKGS